MRRGHKKQLDSLYNEAVESGLVGDDIFNYIYAKSPLAPSDIYIYIINK